MTTTTQLNASDSLVPTSTLASGSSTSTGNPNDTISDLFSSTGSPPLIVAFLAIGLFVVALIGVFGWRRFAQSRGMHNPPIIPNRRRKSIPIGTRPIFWDVWADSGSPKDPEKSRIKSATRWENITPMTAILTFLNPSVQPAVDPSPPDPNCHMHSRMLRSSLSAMRRFYFPDPPPPPPPPPDEKEVEPPVSHHTSDEIEWGDASSLQVSVIVTMPRERRCCSGSDTDPEWMELGEFCVGTMDVPLSKGGG